MMIREERARQEGHESRQIRRQNNKYPVLKAEVTAFVTGITRIVETQEEIIAANLTVDVKRKLPVLLFVFHLWRTPLVPMPTVKPTATMLLQAPSFHLMVLITLQCPSS